MGTYLDRIDAAPDAEKWPLVRKLMAQERQPFFAELRAERPVMKLPDGIWATAPYLHNGSVPTLYDLLLPPAQRPQSFDVGTREYDPERGGYRTGSDAPGNGFTFTARGAGNSNEGHDYNVGRLNHEQRLALVEYMKSL